MLSMTRRKSPMTIVPTCAPDDRILLVIEDDRSFSAVLADFAREKGFKVIIERSAQEAIRAARRFSLAPSHSICC